MDILYSAMARNTAELKQVVVMYCVEDCGRWRNCGGGRMVLYEFSLGN